MARKIIDTYPVISLTIGGEVQKPASYRMSEAEAWSARDEILELIRTSLQRMTKRQMDVDCRIVTEAACEHCNYTWTEHGAEYNGGCCGTDDANSPDRLQVLRALAANVVSADLYPMEDGRRSRVAVDWPWSLASSVLTWLDGGRPAVAADALRDLAARVDGREWVTVWEDPGVYPSNAGAGPLPDRVSTATEPNELASDLVRLLDDMGLTPVKAVA